MATCNICKYAGTPSYKSPCSECKGFSKYEYKKLQTNADRIRAMSDKELAAWLGEHLDCSVCPVGLACVHNNGCPGSLVEWLKQPAE